MSEFRKTGVLVLHNVPRTGTEWEASDIGVLEQVEAVQAALGKLGVPCRTAGIRRLNELPAVVSFGPERVVFNLVEALLGDHRDVAMVPAVCHSLGRECTGGSTPGLTLTLDKWLCKALMQAAGVTVPEALLVFPGDTPRDVAFAPPWIVKPTRADASEGITAASVVHQPGEALAEAIRGIHEGFGQAAIVEQFIAGRELNISLLAEYDQPSVLAIAEIDFSAFPPELPRIVDFDAKWRPETFVYQNTPRMIPAPIPEETAVRVREMALDAWRATGSRDYIRVDMRLDEDLQPYVLEVNINPDITPECGFASALASAGIPYEEFIRRLLVNAEERLKAQLPPVRRSRSRAKSAVPAGMEIRGSVAADREAILAMLRDTRFFRDNELEIAREVLDDALAKPGASYHSHTAVVDGVPGGWVCFGDTPCTVGTYDVYWLVTAPSCQGRGVGRALMAFAEKEIHRLGGHLVVVETAGRAQYNPTRRFYSRIGYRESARLPDFYAPGDDKIIYLKAL